MPVSLQPLPGSPTAEKAVTYRVPESLTACLFALLLWFMPAIASTHEKDPEEINPDKPFARAHIILQVSDGDRSRHSTVLSIASNLIKHYGGDDQVDIQVIAFAAGVSMLYTADNPNAARVRNLQATGVRFHICGNTLDTIARKTGRRPEALPGVIEVPVGVAFLVEEMARGYQAVHP